MCTYTDTHTPAHSCIPSRCFRRLYSDPGERKETKNREGKIIIRNTSLLKFSETRFYFFHSRIDPIAIRFRSPQSLPTEKKYKIKYWSGRILISTCKQSTQDIYVSLDRWII
ncbi:hypothetical protein PUN28_015843 [Cardiocondyla obscurior]|uniref:Uncharacterized protein n=1 Tax=Cardiocondyla obscurior TaxID=286306 RepID=A0AAW2EQM9_9HYME